MKELTTLSVLELEAMRQVCLRKISTFTFTRKNEPLEEWEKSGDKLKFEKQIEEEKVWQERLQKINQQLYDLVENYCIFT